ncbi:ribonuclease P protein subunit p29 [Patella vulgata]|uniref:ribonuclease P protein subunit p29 n=1 Tax=Patella vulgata TaxID=6465 RepID=UPI002180922D|nr:ribonuclease P protein subunit p29 [Patella vulgata]
MELKSNREALYSGLPSSLQSASNKLGIKKVRDGFLKTFLQKTVYTDKKKQRNVPLEHLSVVSEVLECQPKKAKPDLGPRKKRKTLTNMERKKLKIFDIKKEDQKYEKYLPLHNLWKDYIKDLLCGPKDKSDGCLNNDAQKLLKADVHGAILTVKKSKCPSYIHTTGIVLQETRNTFKLITKENKLKCIPKLNSIFTLEDSGIIYTIYGNHFRVKASERAIRKFKSKATVDL